MKVKIEQGVDGWKGVVMVGRRVIFMVVEQKTMGDAARAVADWDAEQRAIGERIIAKLQTKREA